MAELNHPIPVMEEKLGPYKCLFVSMKQGESRLYDTAIKVYP
jgi:hypothetical protein